MSPKSSFQTTLFFNMSTNLILPAAVPIKIRFWFGSSSFILEVLYHVNVYNNKSFPCDILSSNMDFKLFDRRSQIFKVPSKETEAIINGLILLILHFYICLVCAFCVSNAVFLVFVLKTNICPLVNCIKKWFLWQAIT